MLTICSPYAHAPCKTHNMSSFYYLTHPAVPTFMQILAAPNSYHQLFIRSLQPEYVLFNKQFNVMRSLSLQHIRAV